MQPEEITPRIVVILLSVIVLFIAFYLTLMRVDVYLKNTAIDSCGKNARFERKDQSAVISYPIDSFYKDCLKQKGV